MKYRPMGSLDWEVSALGFGCMRLPTHRRYLIKTVDRREAIRTIRMGIDRGVNYIDTAYPYHFGKSETLVGEALQDGYREKVRLITKFPIFLTRKADAFERYLEKQLRKLQTDYLDSYLLHGLSASTFEKVKRFDLVEKLLRAQEQGKIRHLGFSFHDTLPVLKQIVDYHRWDLVMLQHNYMDTGVQGGSEGVAYAHAQGMAVVAMEPVKGGLLANPPQAARKIIREAPVKRTPVDWALQYLWNKPEIACVLSGMSAAKQVEENCASAEQSGADALSAEELATIEQLAAVFRRHVIVNCTACGYCLPCPAGVDIPDCFAILNNVALRQQGDLNQRLHTWFMRRRYKKKARTKAQLEKRPDAGSAALCTQCGVCVKKCPQGLDVPAELEKVHAVLARKEPVTRFLPADDTEPQS